MLTRTFALTVFFALASCSWFRPDPPEYDAVRLESGLVVRDIVVPNAGVEVEAGDAVTLHYELRLADLTLVESSRDSGRPLHFLVGMGTMPAGLEQGLIGMRLFGRRRIVVPPELAYGAEGRPPRIPAGATLTFDVELMEHVAGH
jgi:FKBP-type peptidyl-prolyl cis-trans isomerase